MQKETPLSENRKITTRPDKWEMMATLVDNLNCGVLIEDENRDIVYANKEICRILSVKNSPESLLGMNCMELASMVKYVMREPDRAIDYVVSSVEGRQEIKGLEIELNDYTVAELNGAPLVMGGDFKGYSWNLKDVTERSRAEQTLRNISNVQQTILNGTNYGVVYTDINGIIKSFNRSAEEMLGYSAAELVDKHTPEVYHCKEEIRERAEALSEQLKRKVEPGFGVFVNMARNGVVDTQEWIYVTKGGKRLNVLLSVSCIRDKQEEMIGYLGIIRDITAQKDTVRSLRRTEEKYKNILEKSSEIIYRTNRLGFFTYVNPVAELMTGYTKKELLRMRFVQLISEDYREKALRFYDRQMKKKTPSTYFEFPIHSKTGKELWIGQSVQYTLNENNEVELIALAIDISNQKLAEKRMIESNQKLQLFHNLINNTTDAIQVAREDGRLFYINKAASSLFGIEQDAVSNFHVKDIDLIFRENGSWENYVGALKQSGSLTLESEVVNIWTDKSIAVEVTSKYIQIDGTGYLISNTRDITARKKAELLVKKQEEKYRNIIENMNLGILEVDLDERIEYSNKSFRTMSGYTSRELIGKTSTELFNMDDNSTIIHQKKGERAIGVSDTYEICFKDKHGNTKWWLIGGAPNYNDEGRQIGSIGIHLDITERKKLEKELQEAKLKAEEASKTKESFLANMSHEIRTPLNAITGMIRELGREQLNAEQREYVTICDTSSKHLLSIINNILDMSKIEAGELSLEEKDFELRASFLNVVSMLQKKAEEKGIYLKLNMEKKMKNVFKGDALRMEQILLNLVNNAIKFTAEGGVTIHCDVTHDGEEGQEVKIEVSDTGIGMEAEYLKNVFSKFSQENSSVSRRFGGTGLGMAIAYELVQLMKGKMEVRSEKGKGSCFTVSLFLNAGEAHALPQHTEQNVISLEGVKILLVEDNEMNRVVAQNSLKHCGCEVTEACNGKEALEILAKNTFDVVLMDIQMPVMDGIEAVKIIREQMKLNVPVIALTANAFKSETELCKSVGMDDFVTKPFEEDLLMKTISKCIGRETSVTKKEEVKAVIPQKKYDLSFLKEVSRGDEMFMQKMVMLFIEQSTQTTGQMKSALQQGDYAELSRLAHRVKSSIDNMGIVAAKEKIRTVEHNAKYNIETEQLPELVDEVYTLLEDVNKALKTETLYWFQIPENPSIQWMP